MGSNVLPVDMSAATCRLQVPVSMHAENWQYLVYVTDVFLYDKWVVGTGFIKKQYAYQNFFKSA